MLMVKFYWACISIEQTHVIKDDHDNHNQGTFSDEDPCCMFHDTSSLLLSIGNNNLNPKAADEFKPS